MLVKPSTNQSAFDFVQPEATISHAELPKKHPDKSLTRTGKLLIIEGKHRLLCGNSADIHDIRILLDGYKVQLVHNDPPYNVRVQPQSKDSDSAVSRKLEGDFLTPKDFFSLLNYWFIHLAQALEPGRSFYVWGGYSNITNYPPAIKAAGLYYSQAIIWLKNLAVFTRKDFMGQHEICFYGWKEGAPHKFHGPNNITDVWKIDNVPRRQMIHLTEKPVEIPTRAIQCSSQPGEIVLDLFGGSGSTLFAAHELDRVCYLMEIDAWYCEVILDRCRKLGLSVCEK